MLYSNQFQVVKRTLSELGGFSHIAEWVSSDVSNQRLNLDFQSSGNTAEIC
jgi:hypothetical protein